MVVEDRRAVAVQEISQDDKLSRTSSVLADGVVENVSQVWRAGPLRVRLEEREGETWLVVDAVALDVWRWGVGAALSREEALDWVGFDVQVRLTPALDQFLVELVDVIADLRRASGTVQLEFEDLEEEDDVHSADL